MSDPMADTGRRPFHDWLAELRRGEASEELADRLAEVVSAVQMHGKKGQLRFVLDIAPAGRTVVITDRIETKVPEADRESSVWFGDALGNLTRDDPAQGRLRLVDPDTGEIHD